MKFSLRLLLITLIAVIFTGTTSYKQDNTKLFKADDPNIHYIGRVDFTNPQAPRFWSAGVYIKAKFKGTACEVLINDEVLGNINHNYLEIAIDDKAAYRIKLTGKQNTIKVAEGLANTAHTVIICKDTESSIGHLDFIGFRCDQLLPLPPEPGRKMEFIGDSITSGAGMDQSTVPCNTGLWFDQHNAYMDYAARTARDLNAQWQLTSVSGIGLVHSCCNMSITMPQVFDKVYLGKDSATWDFKRDQPDVVTICLGQNDGIQDSTAFCSAYVKFIGSLRSNYPKADIVCLTSPMADAKLNAVLKRYLAGTVNYVNAQGDEKVHRFYFAKAYNKGCGGHPDIDDHRYIAEELTAYIKQLKGW